MKTGGNRERLEGVLTNSINSETKIRDFAWIVDVRTCEAY
jgi:hypothetical protein